jgi:hypothetical protein
VVELPRRDLQPAVPRRDVRLQRVDAPLQRQSALALRRLLHPFRPARDPKPQAEVDGDPRPAREPVVPGDQAARRSVFAAAAAGPVRPLFRGVEPLRLVRVALDLSLRVDGLQALPSGGDRPGPGLHGALGLGRAAGAGHHQVS